MSDEIAKNVLDVYPLVTVEKLAASRDFFVQHFALQVVFQASWVVMLSGRSDGGISLGLMTSDHPSRPPGPETFDGRGMVVTVQVKDASLAHAGLVEAGVALVHPLTHERWGQKRCMVRDPSGILVDVVEQVAPEPGFWEQHSSI